MHRRRTRLSHQHHTLLTLTGTASLLLGACGSDTASNYSGDPRGDADAHKPGVAVDALGYPTDDCEGFVVDEGTWTVQPGENINYCVRMAIPEEYRDRELVITGWAWNMGTTHHFFMEHSPIAYTKDFPEPCNPDGTQVPFSLLGSANGEGAKIVFGAGEGSGFALSDGRRGKFIPAGGHFRTSHHVTNFTTEPITVAAKYKVCVQDAAATEFPANTLVCNTAAISVPDGVEGSASGTCTAPFDMDVWLFASHAHSHLTKFTLQRYDGTRTLPEVLYESTDWDSPQITMLDEPLHLTQGEGLTYTCHYLGPARFDQEAAAPDAEHCAAFTSYSYPAGREFEVPPNLVGLQLFEGQVSPAGPSVPNSPI